MVAGGISYYGPGKLIFVAGTQDTKAYEIILNYFIDDIKFLNSKKEGRDIIFQQDNARCHT